MIIKMKTLDVDHNEFTLLFGSSYNGQRVRLVDAQHTRKNRRLCIYKLYTMLANSCHK